MPLLLLLLRLRTASGIPTDFATAAAATAAIPTAAATATAIPAATATNIHTACAIPIVAAAASPTATATSTAVPTATAAGMFGFIIFIEFNQDDSREPCSNTLLCNVADALNVFINSNFAHSFTH